MVRSYINGGNSGHKAKSLTRFNYEKFMQLAENSFNVKKYERAVDNCRLAVEFALKQDHPEAAASAYQIWIKALFELKKFQDVRKICREARSKFGNQLDLMYYEFRAAMASGNASKAGRLGVQFIELCKAAGGDEKSVFTDTLDKIDEVESVLKNIQIESSRGDKAKETEQPDGQHK